MREPTRRIAGVVVGVLLALGPGFAAAAATPPDSLSAPNAVPPASTTPPSESPASSEPESAEPDETLIGAGDPDGEVDGTVALVAVVGFLALLAVASWWMVRRSDPDAQPMPAGRTGGPPPGDLI